MMKPTLIFALLCCLTFLVKDATSKKQIVLYWGQNTARLPEKELRHFCSAGEYDVIVVGYITKFFASPNTRYPGMNLGVHCGVLQNKAYPALFECGDIGKAIKLCQSRGIKVLLGIEGKTGPQYLTKPGDGKLFAQRIWNLFLGGTNAKSLRPFKRAIMDGINLNIASGDDRYYAEMVENFNQLMSKDRARTYLITASPTCGQPSTDFKSVFQKRPELFDALYIKHDYTKNCHPTSSEFGENLEKWLKVIRVMNARSFKNTKFYINIVMSLDIQFYKTEFDEFEEIYKKTLKDIPEFGGVSLWDAGWDDLQLIDNQRYSTHVRLLFEGPKTTVPPLLVGAKTTTTTTTTTTEQPIAPRKIAALWGSNLARAELGVNEESLRFFCELGIYDTIIVNTLTDDQNDQNLHNLPGLNFANHCIPKMGPRYKNYLRCDAMGHDIRFCQRKGVKVLLNIGGSVKFIGFASRNESLQLASNLWKLFLGGAKQARSEKLPRTFGKTVLDGINLELRVSEQSFFVDFVIEMRRLMDGPTSTKKYLITANPNCFHPNRVLHDAFTNAISTFDHLYVNFDHAICSINQPSKFEPVFHLWYDYTLRDNGPDLYIGLPSSPRNTRDSQRYLQRNQINSRLERYLRTYKNFGGVLLNDASWDNLELVNNRRYSEDLGKVIRLTSRKTTPAPREKTKPRTIFLKPTVGLEGGEFDGNKNRDRDTDDDDETDIFGNPRKKNDGPTIFYASGVNRSANIVLMCSMIILSFVMCYMK